MLNKNQAMEDAAQMEELRKWRESQQPVEYAGSEPYTIGSALFAVGVVAAVFGVCWVSMPEFRAFISIMGN